MKPAEVTNAKLLHSPLLLLVAAIFGFSYSFIDNINPLPGVIFGFMGLGGDLLGTIITAIQMIISPGILIKCAIFLIAGILVAALVIGFFMSGYMSVLKGVILNGNSGKKAFIAGIEKSFGTSVKSAFYMIFTMFLMIIIVIIAAVPSLFTMWSSLNGKSEMLPLAVFVLAISAFAILCSLLFYNVYIAFWYPAIAFGYKDFILASKRIIDDSFFKIAGKILKYIIIFGIISIAGMLTRYFFHSFIENIIAFISLIALEGALITIWFLRFTTYSASVFAIQLRKKAS